MCSATRMKRVTVCRGVSRPPAPVRRSRSRWRPRTSRRCTDVFLTVCRVTLRSSNYEHPCTPLTRRARALTQGTQGHATPTPHAHAPRRSAARGPGGWTALQTARLPPASHQTSPLASPPRSLPVRSRAAREVRCIPPPPPSAPLLSTPLGHQTRPGSGRRARRLVARGRAACT